MRVVFIRTNGVNPDPRVEKEVNSIIKDGSNKVTVLAWDRESDKNTKSYLSLENGKVDIYRFGIPSEWGGGFKKNLFPLIRFSRGVNRWLKIHESEYDCIHCCDLPTAMMASPYIKRKKFVYDIFDYFADTAHAPKVVIDYAKRKEKSMIQMADATIICSEKRKMQIGDAVPKKLYVIHNSPDLQQFNKAVSDEKHIIKSLSDKTKVVYVGNLVKERFIDVVADIISNNNDYEFHVGGVGPLEEKIKKMSEKYSNIFYYGKLQYSDVLSLENDCDIMLALYDPSVPNNHYAAPNKFYEALLVGKPIIMLKNTGMDDIVRKEKIGIISNSNSIQDLTETLNKTRKLCYEIDIKERMNRLYQKNYSWTIMEKRLIDLYENI